MPTLFMVLLLFGSISADCGMGCLRCDVNSRCLYCDTTLQYYLNGTTCAQYNNPNCALLSIGGVCLQCVANYSISLTNSTCTKLTNTQIVPKCLYYNSLGNCISCSTGLVFNGTDCAPPPVNITGCDVYSSVTKCLSCIKGLMTNFDQTACTPSPNITNCLAYSPANCVRCADGFIRNPNVFVRTLLNSGLYTDAVTAWLTTLSPNFFPQYVCEKTSVSDCLTYRDSDFCSQCKSGFFTTPDGKCVKFPVMQIPNCLTYSSPTQCASCSSGYYLAQDYNSCVKVSSVAGCSLYDGRSTLSTCTLCTSDRYLVNNVCQNRTVSINNCGNYSAAFDNCASCSSGYVLSPDRLACVSTINNCLSYTFTTVTSGNTTNTTASCSACANGYRLNPDAASSANACVLGQIGNCLSYNNSNSADNCTLCANGFYLNGTGSNCTTQVNISNCQNYSSFGQGTCLTCIPGSQLFSVENQCLAAVPQPFCATYNNASQCTGCITGYFLNATNCTQIPSSLPNCNQAIINSTTLVCTLCQANFNLFNGSCYNSQPLISENCDDLLLTNGNYTCSQCKTGFLELSLRNFPLCYNLALPEWQTWPSPKSNCLVHGTNMTCLACQDGYAIKSDGTCDLVSNCAGGVLLYELQGSTSGWSISRKNVCVSNGLTGCQEFQSSLTNQSAICTRCNSSLVPVLNILDVRSTLYSSNSSIQPTSRFPSILECANASTFSREVVQTNCAYFVKDSSASSSLYYCGRCAFGFSGTVSSAGSVQFMSNCASISTCDSSTTLFGLNGNINALLSCHRCTSGIPQLNVVLDQGTGLYAFKVGVSSTVCASTVISSCAVVLNVFATQSATTSTAQCGACGAGFKLVNGACTQISNCNNPNPLGVNACSQCDTGYTFQMSDQGVDYTSCVSSTSAPNCLAIVPASGNTAAYCSICKAGFYLNADNQCEQFLLPKCMNPTYPLSVTAQSIPTLISQTALFPAISGCHTCTTGYVSVAQPSSQFVCVQSNYITRTLPTPTEYIPFCLKYTSNKDSLNFDYLCAQCSIGYVLSSSQTQCFSGAALPNCATTNDGINCLACAPRFSLVNNKCVANSILNCATYSTLNSQTLTCLSCNNGFYLSANSCLAGSVSNCATYQDAQPAKCLSCLTGFQLITRTDSSTFCFRIDPALKCLSVDSAKFQSGTLSCTQCAANFVAFWKPVNNTLNSACLSYPLINNCFQYANVAITDPSSLSCILCNTGFFLSNKNCISLTKVSNCTVYSASSDQCTLCSTGYFLQNNTCVAFPTGIPFCVSYTDQQNCTACLPEYFLQNGQCEPVTTPIEHCMTYSSNITCSKCHPNFYVSGSVCVQAQGSNCFNYTSNGYCASCIQGTYMSTSGSCLSIGDSNCLSAANGECTACTPGYYPSGLTCLPPPTPIANCLTYDSPVTCLKCETNFTLSVGRKNCTSQFNYYIDPNCATSEAVASSVCSQCALGSVFLNNACVACNLTVGCATCHPQNISNCIFCQSGFYMDNSGKCISTNMDTGSSNNNLTNQNISGNGTTGVEILKMTLLAIFLMFN